MTVRHRGALAAMAAGAALTVATLAAYALRPATDSTGWLIG